MHRRRATVQWQHLVNGNVAAARSGEWAQHFSNASCLQIEFFEMFKLQTFKLFCCPPSREWCKVVICEHVCLSVCSHISRTMWSNFIKFSVHVDRYRGSVIIWFRCDILCTSCFVDAVMFYIMGSRDKRPLLDHFHFRSRDRRHFV